MTEKKLLTVFIVSILFMGVPLALQVEEDHFKDINLCKLKKNYTALTPSESDNSFAPTVQLMRVILFSLQDLGLGFVRRAKTISDHLLKDDIIMSNKSPQIIKFREKIQEFENKYSSCADMGELFYLVDFYSYAIADYYEMHKNGTLNGDAKIIYDVLIKYSPADLDAEYEEKFMNNFISKFGEKVNELRDKLKKEKDGEKILEWWENTKALKTSEEKFQAFEEYIKLHAMDNI